MKTLVYYTIGCSRAYIEMLEISVTSLRKVYNGDIGILCDESMVEECKSRMPDVLVWPVPDSATGPIASMNKLRIYDAISVDDYDKILYIDTDILVLKSLEPYFEGVTEEGKLYVYTETTNQEKHRDLFWSLQTYTEEDYTFFKQENILPFNAGTFAFVSSETMKNHFTGVRDLIATHDGPYFYEQSFMNVYFNLRNITNRSVFFYDNYIFFPQIGKHYPNAILLHFADASDSAANKCKRMRDYLALRVFPTRNEMLSVVPKYGVYAEIGVFRAEFSDILCKTLHPRELVLFDLFSGRVDSGDQDGNNMQYVDTREVYNHLMNVSRVFPGLRVMRGDSSSNLRTFPDNTFDMIYIDGDHSYEGVKKDLLVAYSKVKPGGWIMGHDFGINPDKTKNYYDFGVEKAVVEFCQYYRQSVCVVGMDGCISFGIQLRK